MASKEKTISINFDTTGRTKEEVKALKKIIQTHVTKFAILFKDIDSKYLDSLVELLMMYINAPITQRKLQRKEHKDTVKKTTSEIAHKIHFILFKIFDEVDKTVPTHEDIMASISGIGLGNSQYLKDFVDKILKITEGDVDVVEEALKVMADYYSSNKKERAEIRARADKSLAIGKAEGAKGIPKLHKITLEMFDLIDSGVPLSKYFELKKETSEKLMKESGSPRVVRVVLELLDKYMAIESKKERDIIKKNLVESSAGVFNKSEFKCQEITLKAMETMDEIDFGNPKGKAN